MRYEIIVDHGETANKCTIVPLSYREDFCIHPVGLKHVLSADILLHPLGQALPALDLQGGAKIKSLAAIDCVWRRLEPILDKIETPHPLMVSIPPGFRTAYPRTSRLDFDPEGGLATIEAIFIAAAFCGSWDQSLLREYFFAEEFLRRNEASFRSYGIDPHFDAPVYQPLYPKNSRSRRMGRGRLPL